MLKGIIFDFDGLILDTETPIYRAWQEVYDRYQCEFPKERLISSIGSTEKLFDPMYYLESICDVGINTTDINLHIDRRITELVATQPMMPGICKLITDANAMGIKLAIASSSPLSWVKPKLINLKIDRYFCCYATKEEVCLTKPSPELFQLAMAKLKLANHEVVAIEDSVLGIESAKGAGIFSIAIPANMTKGLDFSKADLVIDSAADIDIHSLASKF